MSLRRIFTRRLLIYPWFLQMLAANCSIFGFRLREVPHTSQRNKSVSLFKIPSTNDDFNKEWRKKVLHIITKERVIDESLKTQIKKFICENHYETSMLIVNPIKTTLKPGSLPTLNLPDKILIKFDKNCSKLPFSFCFR